MLQYIFTDKAFVAVFGEAAAGKKRLIRRWDFYDEYISEVVFETAGVGATDHDCELKFVIGREYGSRNNFDAFVTVSNTASNTRKDRLLLFNDTATTEIYTTLYCPDDRFRSSLIVSHRLYIVVVSY